MDFLEFILKVAEEKRERAFILKGGKGSGWFKPPKGTHVGRTKGKGWERWQKRLAGAAEGKRGKARAKGKSGGDSITRDAYYRTAIAGLANRGWRAKAATVAGKKQVNIGGKLISRNEYLIGRKLAAPLSVARESAKKFVSGAKLITSKYEGADFITGEKIKPGQKIYYKPGVTILESTLSPFL